MRTLARGVLLVCCVAGVLGFAGCGASVTGTASSAQNDYAVTGCDGSPIAHAPASPATATSPTSVYVGTMGSISGQKNAIFAIAAANGALQWCARFALTRTYTCPAAASCPAPPTADVGTPLVADGTAYVCVSGGSPGATYAFDAANGALRWSRETGCRSGAIPFEDNARPILAGGVLYSGDYGLAPADGSVRWRLPQPTAHATIGAVANGMAYVYSENTLSAIRLSDNTVAWTYALDAAIGDLPVPSGGYLYVGDIGGDSPPAATPGLPDTYALDATTGKVVWRASTGIVSGSSAAVAGGRVYVGGANALIALDATTGVIRWRVFLSTGGSVQSTPVVNAGVVYFVGDGAYAVDAATGAVRWHNTLDWSQSHWYSGPALRDGTLYLSGMDGGGNGTLYGLDAATGAIRWQRSGFNQLAPPAV